MKRKNKVLMVFVAPITYRSKKHKEKNEKASINEENKSTIKE
jgi:hypothetical protein